MSKFLPIDSLHVEEVVERPDPNIAKIAKVKQLVARKPQIKKVNRRGNNRFNPNAGVNKIILDMLADGKPHHAVEADGMLIEAGYSPKGLYSKMQRLVRHGYVNQPAKGLWQITLKHEDVNSRG